MRGICAVLMPQLTPVLMTLICSSFSFVGRCASRTFRRLPRFKRLSLQQQQHKHHVGNELSAAPQTAA